MKVTLKRMALILALCMALSGLLISLAEPLTTEPITIRILTKRESYSTLDNTNELWAFRYLEYYMRQKGYDITIEAESVAEPADQIALRLGADNLPDLVIAIAPTAAQVAVYGAQEHIILDWTPYLNEETMPNVCRLLEYDPSAKAQSVCWDGGIYGIPFFSDRNWGFSSGNVSGQIGISVNTKWLEECGLDLPETMEEFIDMLRAFKDIELDNGLEPFPHVSAVHQLEGYIWTAMGYYGGNLLCSGQNLAIKAGNVELPASTEDYRTFVELMNTCYTEGLIPQDYVTMDANTARAYAASGQVGSYGDYHLSLAITDTFKDWTIVKPVTIGDNTEIAVSVAPVSTANCIWASAKTEYPEVLAEMIDYLYSPEGAYYYGYGPKQGEDPLGMLDGWFVNEEGEITTQAVEDGLYETLNLYFLDYVYPVCHVGNEVDRWVVANELAGLTKDIEDTSFIDAITGDEIVLLGTGYCMPEALEGVDGYYRNNHVDMWEKCTTTVKLPTVYLTPEQSVRASEIKTLLDDHIKNETALFITGRRPLEEVDQYFEELKTLGLDEYMELYRDAYAPYIETVFGK